ncbi:MAG: methyltransferase domain-containing protein [Ignavibacteria bacterium]|jgi:precorrin-6B methylase 2|nr:methyltransferase domain-containing protein [Ignavibacteria bacterium]MCU7500122.1 methyltransferase domain-containing protein [Ignavibacteria bacterium]MCU7513255.1 methyltransferase domain-containing protein [Ignavibacteria bacterium]MCU7519424.1 methyltransferase domain-containing protein [Ignavibacteria bacterium]MCU7524948.1 methyltransferase domain-containing protein [Ignavibacteria bacterium]
MKHVKKYYLFILTLFFIQNVSFSQVPFVPTPYEVVEGMLKLADVGEDDIVYDLGCGDGRIVVTAAAKYGAHGLGVDNDPQRVKESMENVESNGVKDKVEIRQENLFKTDLSKATVVTLYLLSDINVKLRPKLFDELRPGTRIVSNSFDMDEWEPEQINLVNGRTLYFWKIPANTSGRWEWVIPNGTSNENYTLTLNQKFQKVNGTLEVGKETYQIMNTKLDGDSLEFSILRNVGDKQVKHTFKGKAMENMFQGTLQRQDENELAFSAKRKIGTMKPIDPLMIKRAGF